MKGQGGLFLLAGEAEHLDPSAIAEGPRRDITEATKATEEVPSRKKRRLGWIKTALNTRGIGKER